MTERTALFLAGLSHQWFLLVLPLPVVFGVAAHYAGVQQERTRTGAGALARQLGRVVRMVTLVLFAGSLAVFVVAFFHVGCATLKAHSVQCMSNVKQLALGALMYAEDYDERFPASTRWAEAIDSRVRKAGSNTEASGNPFRCLAAESPASYGMNAALGGFSQSDIDAPANTVLLFEADAPVRSFAGGSRDVAQERHSGMPNVAFADGHVKGKNAFGLKELNWSLKETSNRQRSVSSR